MISEYIADVRFSPRRFQSDDIRLALRSIIHWKHHTLRASFTECASFTVRTLRRMTDTAADCKGDCSIIVIAALSLYTLAALHNRTATWSMIVDADTTRLPSTEPTGHATFRPTLCQIAIGSVCSLVRLPGVERTRRGTDAPRCVRTISSDNLPPRGPWNEYFQIPCSHPMSSIPVA